MLRQHIPQRIHRPAVDVHLVVQVRAGGEAGVAHQRDPLAPGDPLALRGPGSSTRGRTWSPCRSRGRSRSCCRSPTPSPRRGPRRRRAPRSGCPSGPSRRCPRAGGPCAGSGATRIEEKALESQPWVGMMDGVAASRAECTARLSAASLNEEASRLARRISAFRSTRISWERRIALPASPTAGPTVGPPMPAACTWGSIGSRLARTLMRASRWEMRERVSARPARRPLSSPSCCSSRAFSCASWADLERSTVRETVT